MPVNSRLNKSPFTMREKKILKKAFKENKNVYVVPTNVTLTQSSTTLANVTNFALPVLAYKTYVYTLSITSTANAAAGAKFGITAPTAVLVCGQQQVDSTSSSATSVASIAGGATAAAVEIFATGVYKGNADGLFQIQAAQNASGANDTVILAGSYLKLEEVLD